MAAIAEGLQEWDTVGTVLRFRHQLQGLPWSFIWFDLPVMSVPSPHEHLTKRRGHVRFRMKKQHKRSKFLDLTLHHWLCFPFQYTLLGLSHLNPKACLQMSDFQNIKWLDKSCSKEIAHSADMSKHVHCRIFYPVNKFSRPGAFHLVYQVLLHYTKPKREIPSEQQFPKKIKNVNVKLSKCKRKHGSLFVLKHMSNPSISLGRY